MCTRLSNVEAGVAVQTTKPFNSCIILKPSKEYHWDMSLSSHYQHQPLVAGSLFWADLRETVVLNFDDIYEEMCECISLDTLCVKIRVWWVIALDDILDMRVKWRAWAQLRKITRYPQSEEMVVCAEFEARRRQNKL